MPIRSVQAHAPAFSITGEPVFPYPLRTFRPRRFGKARSGVICHQAVLTGLTPSPARFPRLVLRRPHPCAFPFIIAAFSPFCKGDLQIFQGGTRGSASGLRKGVPPLTLSRDWVGDFSILLPRVARGFRLCGGDFPCVKAINFNKKIKPEHAHRRTPSGDKLPLRHRRDSPVCRAVHPPMCPAQRQFRVA